MSDHLRVRLVFLKKMLAQFPLGLWEHSLARVPLAHCRSSSLSVTKGVKVKHSLR